MVDAQRAHLARAFRQQRRRSSDRARADLPRWTPDIHRFGEEPEVERLTFPDSLAVFEDVVDLTGHLVTGCALGDPPVAALRHPAQRRLAAPTDPNGDVRLRRSRAEAEGAVGEPSRPERRELVVEGGPDGVDGLVGDRAALVV